MSCAGCALSAVPVLSFICAACRAFGDGGTDDDVCGPSCTGCTHAEEELHGPHCGPCLAAWGSAQIGPLYSKAP